MKLLEELTVSSEIDNRKIEWEGVFLNTLQ